MVTLRGRWGEDRQAHPTAQPEVTLKSSFCTFNYIMRALNTVIRWLVGGLFIFSGLVKVNDPIGTSIKLHEYFDLFAVEFASFFEIFIPYTLPIAVFLVVLEVALGVAVLVNFRMRITMWILLVLIIFFTLLTGYSHFTGNVTDCGCFGDAIPLTPKQSFIKDIILTVLIGWLFIFRSRFLPTFGRERFATVVTVLGTVVSLWIAIAAIRHLPFIDFRPYKVGVNIPQQRQPEEAPRTIWIMEKDGETFEFENYPTEGGYTYDSSYVANPDKIIPKITDYAIWETGGNDVTEESFEGIKLLVIAQDLEKAKDKGLKRVPALAKLVESYGGTPWLVTSSGEGTTDTYRHEYQLSMPYYFGDATLLKAIVRANPGVVLMKDGTILGKWHWRDFDEAEKAIPDLLK